MKMHTVVDANNRVVIFVIDDVRISAYADYTSAHTAWREATDDPPEGAQQPFRVVCIDTSINLE